jgi:hypothetical protein
LPELVQQAPKKAPRKAPKRALRGLKKRVVRKADGRYLILYERA